MLRLRWQRLILDEIGKSVGKKQRFYVYGKGEVKSEKQAIQYVGRYTGRPPIAESRILSYDERKVRFYYVRHEDGKRVEEEGILFKD